MSLLIATLIVTLAMSSYAYALIARIFRPIPKPHRRQLPGMASGEVQGRDSDRELDAAAAREVKLSRRLIRHDIDPATYQRAMSDLAHGKGARRHGPRPRGPVPGSGP